MAEYLESKRAHFVKWMQDNNFRVNPNVVLKYSGPEYGFTVHAAGPIKSGEILFQIPQDAQLSIETSELWNKLKKKDREVFQTVPEGDWLSLILTMMYENSLTNSRWRAYLDILPEKLDSPLFWGDEDLEELKGTSIADKIGADEIRQAYDDVIVPVLKAYPKLFPNGEKNPLFSFEMFRRMGSIIQAYSFTPEHIAMMPMADMLNHATGKNNARLFLDGDDEEDEDDEDDEEAETAEPAAKRRKLIEEAERAEKEAAAGFDPFALKMRAIRDIEAGEELYNTYGDLGSSELLRKYGYVEHSENPHDTVDVSLQTALDGFRKALAEHDEEAIKNLVDEKIAYLRANGVLPDPTGDQDSEDDEMMEPVNDDDIEFSVQRPAEGEELGGVLSYIAKVMAASPEEFEAFKKRVDANAAQEFPSGEEDEDNEEEEEEVKPKKKGASTSPAAGKKDKKRGRPEPEEEEDEGEDDDDEEVDEEQFLQMLGMMQDDGTELVDIETNNTALLNKLLKSVLEHRLSLFPHSLEDDEKLLADEAALRNKHHRMAIVVRRNEKRLLKNLLNSL